MPSRRISSISWCGRFEYAITRPVGSSIVIAPPTDEAIAFASANRSPTPIEVNRSVSSENAGALLDVISASRCRHAISSGVLSNATPDSSATWARPIRSSPKAFTTTAR